MPILFPVCAAKPFLCISDEIQIFKIKMAIPQILTMYSLDEIYELMEEHQALLKAYACFQRIDVEAKNFIILGYQISEVHFTGYLLLLYELRISTAAINILPKKYFRLALLRKDFDQIFFKYLRVFL